jgi:hypothetical protein
VPRIGSTDDYHAGLGGGRADPSDQGRIYRQGHWGDQVEFRNPVITGERLSPNVRTVRGEAMTIHFRRLSMTVAALLAAAAWLLGRVPSTATPVPMAKPPTADEVRKRLFATCWYETSKVVAGKEDPNGPLGWKFGPDEVEIWQITGELVTDRMVGGATTDVSAKAWRLDIIRKGERGRVAILPSIFKFDGDTLVWVTEFPGDGWYQQVDPNGHYKGRPTGFESTGRNRYAVYRLKPCEYLQTTPPN